MSTYEERRMELLQRRLRARTRADGSPQHGYEQNVAAIKAEMELISVRAAVAKDIEDGN